MDGGIPIDAVFVVDASEASRAIFPVVKTALRTFVRHLLEARPAGVPRLERVRLSVVGCRSLSPTDDGGCTFNPFVVGEREFNAQLERLALVGDYTDRSLAVAIRHLAEMPRSERFREVNDNGWRHWAAAVRCVFLCGMRGCRQETPGIEEIFEESMCAFDRGMFFNVGGLFKDDMSRFFCHSYSILDAPVTSASFVKKLMGGDLCDGLINDLDWEFEKITDAHLPEPDDYEPISCRCRTCGLEQRMNDVLDPCPACGAVGMEILR